MNLKKLMLIIQKEAQTLFRNKRILKGIFAPLVLLPFLLMGYQAVANSTSETTEKTQSQISLENPDKLPPSLLAILKSDPLLDILSEDSSEIGSSASGKSSAPAESSSDAPDAVLAFEARGDVSTAIVKYDFGRSAGQRASERLIASLETYRRQEQALLIQEVGADPKEIEAPKLEEVNLASANEEAGRALSNYLPLGLILYALTMIASFAIEMTTSEKEAGTMETLLSVPLTKMEMILGKFGACILFSTTTIAVMLMAIYAMLPLFVNMDVIQLALSPMLFLTVFLTLLPLLLVISALCIATGMFASSYKESSAFLMPVMFMIMIPSYVSTIPGIEINGFLTLVPVVNASLLMKSAFLNQLNYGYFVTTTVVNLLFSVMSLVFMFKVFGTEKIVFGAGKDFSFSLNRKLIKPRSLLEAEDVFLVLALVIFLFINFGVVMPEYFSFETVFLVSQYGLFLCLPIAVLWYMKVDLRSAVNLNMPQKEGRLVALATGAVLWLMTFGLAFGYQKLISPYVTEAPTLALLEEQMKNWSPLLQFIFIALTPGICEEFIFRGFALKPLQKRFGSTAAVVMVALLFAIVHLDVVRLLPTFALGLVFGHLTVKTKSLYPAMALHVLNNAVAIFL